ncbi:MAG: thiamine pyrophosphate-dependent enzyme, partial [Anaerolineales bacterium]|nr:thiamine pyrophosphate-dependent enzyme [Anaerolineales bacterium]
YLESLAGSAYSKAIEGLPGPVHLNLPFRKPLEPVSDSTLDAPTSVDTRQEAHAAIRPLARVSGGETISAVALRSVGDLIRRHARGLIILGPRSFADEYQAELSNLATLSGYPVLADPLSGARFSGNAERDVVLCGGYDWYIQGSGQADLILSIGSQPTSSGLEKYLAGLDGAVRISIQPGGRWLDPSHQTQISVEAQPDAAVAALAEVLAEKPPEDSARRTWRDRFKIAELQVNIVLDERIDRDYCEGMAARDLVATLTPGSLVFAANSLSIRHIDRYATRSNVALHIFANRGASGIDGNISTAAGLAAGFGRPITLLIGDLAFHHDQTGLLAFQKYAPGSRIVLINNHGGGIFQQLPVASFEPQFEEYFRTPVDLDYASLTAAYGGHYSSASYRSEFLELLGASVDPGGFQVIEFISQIERHEKNRVEITNLIKERMKS